MPHIFWVDRLSFIVCICDIEDKSRGCILKYNDDLSISECFKVESDSNLQFDADAVEVWFMLNCMKAMIISLIQFIL